MPGHSSCSACSGACGVDREGAVYAVEPMTPGVPRRENRVDPRRGAETVALHRRRGQRGRQAHGHRPRRAVLPRRVRDRHLEPGAADPLHARQRAHRGCRRARLHALARHGRRPARARACRCSRSRRWRPGARVRPARHHAAGRADVLQRARDARPGADPAARRATARDDDPIVLAGGPCASNPEPLAPFIDVLLHGRGRGGAATRPRRPRGPLRHARRAPATRWRRLPYLYVPALRARTRSTARSTPSSTSPPSPAAGRALRQRHLQRAPASRSCAAAPAAAASATPAPGTGRCASARSTTSSRPASSSSAARATTSSRSRRSPPATTRASSGAIARDQARAPVAAPVAAIQPGRHGTGGDERRRPTRARDRITLAPEAATQRMRDIICKTITDEMIERAIDAAFGPATRRSSSTS